MGGGAAVVLALHLAEVGSQRDQTNTGGDHIQLLSDQALMIVRGFISGDPFPCLVLYLDPEGLQYRRGESEGGIVVAGREEQNGRGVQTVGVALYIFSVQITIHYQTEAVDMGGLVEGVGNCLIGLTEVTVVIAPDPAVQTVVQAGAITVIAG